MLKWFLAFIFGETMDFNPTKETRNQAENENDIIAEQYLAKVASYSELCNEKISSSYVCIEQIKRIFSSESERQKVSCDDLLKEIQKSPLALICLAKSISKSAHKQASKREEQELFKVLKNNIPQIDPKKLPNSGKNALKPLLDGTIVPWCKGISKFETIKTIDGTFKLPKSDNINYIFAKTTIDTGGGQRNVDIETRKFIEWAKKQTVIVAIILDGSGVDQSLFDIKDLPDNVWIGNNKQFQERVQKELQK